MICFKLFGVFLALTTFFFGSAYGFDADQQAFIKSFVEHYDFNAAGRYTHEYHPYLLDKTAQSFTKLEHRLTQEGMSLDGRIIIAGYEEQAIPSYYTDFRSEKIDDEASSKGRAGWSLQLHNQFGLMTGFLLKDINYLNHRWMQDGACIFEHINPDSVEIFNDRGGVFQEHAFKDSYPLLKSFSETLHARFNSCDGKKMFHYLVNFWQALYESQGTASGDMPAGTQDILFSISYADHLRDSSLPLRKYYTGGDITYPIETTMNQAAAATKNSQKFVKTFAPRLEAIDDKKTAYVFCSFVDGVGKSTMLGNVRNWSKHGSDVHKYERVDNSSSQYAQLYSFKDNVWIADLPAQVSHFTYKPDGMVYVPLGDEVEPDEYDRVYTHVCSHKEQYITEFRHLLERVQGIYESQGPLAPALNDHNNPVYTYAKNVILLKALRSNMMRCWIPFSYHGEQYLFNYFDTKELRILRPLGHAPSSGLKNIESEQMLFYDGVRFPLPYDNFLDHLVDLLKEQGIQKVVFVDFISMYPRSSRENIRINYLMQQMALLDPNYDTQSSLYKNFLSPAELYADMRKNQTHTCMYRAFVHEVFIRLALYRLLEARNEKDLTGVPIEQITQSLVRELGGSIHDTARSYVQDICKKKFIKEYESLKRMYGKTKDFVNVQQFSFELVSHFSDFMVDLFTKSYTNDRLRELWSGLSGQVAKVHDMAQQADEQIVELDNGSLVHSLYEFPAEFRDASYLRPCLQTLRACWYASLGNLLESSNKVIEHERYHIAPHALIRGPQNSYFMVRKHFQPWHGTPPALPYGYNLSASRNNEWGEFLDTPYCLDWEPNGTNYGLYAFNCDLTQEESSFRYLTTVSEIVYDEHKNHGTDRIVSASKVLKLLRKSRRWRFDKQSLSRQASRNGTYPGIIEVRKQQESRKVRKLPVFWGSDEQRSGAQLLVIALATLEMILKDPQADIAVRKGNRKDFAAALQLFEEVVLPKYYGILFEFPLFSDYSKVTPLFGWEMLTDSDAQYI